MVLRTCVACRNKAQKRELLRLAAAAQCGAEDPWIWQGTIGARSVVLVFDLLQVFPGRGAYCHAAPLCAGSMDLVGQALGTIFRAGAEHNSRRRRQTPGAAGRPVAEALQMASVMLEERSKKGRRRAWEESVFARVRAVLEQLVGTPQGTRKKKLRIRM